MSKTELPPARVMSKAFYEKGRDDVVKMDVIDIQGRESLMLSFEGVASDWRQGVWLGTDDGILINGEDCGSARVWSDTAPREVLIRCRSRNGLLHLYNIWDRGNGPESQAWSSGMVVERLANGWRYRCNDIGFVTEFSKLVFRLEFVK